MWKSDFGHTHLAKLFQGQLPTLFVDATMWKEMLRVAELPGEIESRRVVTIVQ